ncbi:MAG: flagellar motor protein MotD [Legionellaceae bacterium]|nr:flagellar motor protein MotD [Legionellaceae bacterium]
MRTRKRKQAAEPDDTHRWLISYADFITLLFAFFVVMYAISSVNVSKYQSLAEGMQTAFNTHDKRRPSTVLKEHKQTSEYVVYDQEAFNELDNALDALRDSDYIIQRHDGWIELDIKAGALFDSASADLRPEALAKLMKLANVIKKLPYPIALEGYTDNIPIQTPQFPSNWELSAARAAAVARVLNGFGVENGRITVTGYGDQYPVSENKTEEGRARNRRVNIVIAKDKTIPRLLNPELGHSEGQQSSPSAVSTIPTVEVEKKE